MPDRSLPRDNDQEGGYLVHLAGPPVRVGSVIRQRCLWCGALIEERDLDRVAVPEGQEPTRFIDDEGRPVGGWEGFVAVETHGEREVVVGFVQKWKIDEPSGGDLPEHCCADLPNEVTA